MNYNFLSPLESKEAFRVLLTRLKEDSELDALIILYVRNCLNQYPAFHPSKGRFGEGGKDIVAVENRSTLEYYSYIMKRGNLSKNLDGKYGIIKQMRDAIVIGLPEEKYINKKRTAIVVYNGREGARGAVKRFDDERVKLEIEAKDVLLRPIERWDIDILVEKLWHYREILKESADINRIYSQVLEHHNMVVEFKDIYEKMNHSSNNNHDKNNKVSELAFWFYNRIKHNEYKSGYSDTVNIGMRRMYGK
jgi:hypothetical protein